jgi:hypothetical protein
MTQYTSTYDALIKAGYSPDEAKKLAEGIVVGYDINKPDFVTAWTEPPSAASKDTPPVYPYNNVMATKGGHSFEMDDTPERERVRIQHGNGTFLEMHPNGDEVHKIVRNGYTIIAGDHNISIGVDDGNLAKKLNITVYGDCYMNVKGDKIEEIDGNFEQHIKGHYTQTVNKTSTITSFGDMVINAGSSVVGTLEINTSDSVVFSADIMVAGEVACDKVTAASRVDAGSGMSIGAGVTATVAAAAGFPPAGLVIHNGGGIGVNTGVALPDTISCAGPILAIGPIEAATAINAPIMSNVVSSSIIGSDIVNSLLRQLSKVFAPFGPTSPQNKEKPAMRA